MAEDTIDNYDYEEGTEELVKKGFVQYHRADLRGEGLTPVAVTHCNSIQRVEQSSRDENQSVLVMVDSKMVVADEDFATMRDLWVAAKESIARRQMGMGGKR